MNAENATCTKFLLKTHPAKFSNEVTMVASKDLVIWICASATSSSNLNSHQSWVKLHMVRKRSDNDGLI